MPRTTPGSPSLFDAASLRDLRKIEEKASEVLRQCEYLRRNGPSDEIRFGLIAQEAWSAWRAAARADRRNAKRNGWHIWRWRLPVGYEVPR